MSAEPEQWAISEALKEVQQRHPNGLFGPKVDFHCPYDETTLRVDLTREGFYACPVCHTPFEAELPFASDAWLVRFFRRIFRKPEATHD